MKNVRREIQIPQLIEGNIFVNFNGLYTATDQQQRRVAAELRACTHASTS